MTTSAFFSNVWSSEHLCPINGTILELEEDDPAASLRKVTLKNLPPASFAIKPDKHAGIKCFRGNKRGAGRRCDYILFTENLILFIDLKSSVPKTSYSANEIKYACLSDEEHGIQMKASDCLADYIDSVRKKFCACDMFSRCNRKYIIFTLSNNPQVVGHNPSASDGGRPTAQYQKTFDSPIRIVKVTNGATFDFSLLP